LFQNYQWRHGIAMPLSVNGQLKDEEGKQFVGGYQDLTGKSWWIAD
jgi:hypothetical protein